MQAPCWVHWNRATAPHELTREGDRLRAQGEPVTGWVIWGLVRVGGAELWIMF